MTVEVDVPEEWRTEFVMTREVAGRGLCGVQRFIYTCGLLTDLSFSGLTYGYSARYCYEVPLDARAALGEWDGVGDPPGAWVKEKVSERLGPGAHAEAWVMRYRLAKTPEAKQIVYDELRKHRLRLEGERLAAEQLARALASIDQLLASGARP